VLTVKNTGSFDQQIILEKKVVQHIQNERKDIENYTPLKFSPLFETAQGDDQEEQANNYYYFFHKFIGPYENETDTNVVLVEFSKYYELGNIYQMDKPFDNYFKN